VDAKSLLAERFEAHRSHLEAVAYRMLGSRSEAEDAVQEGWLRFSRSDAAAIDNLGGWLTTVVSRVCLDVLRARRAHPEASLDARLPDPIISDDDGADPEHEALMSDAIGLALLVVLDTLSPAERMAFVLHDMFAVPFSDIAPIVGRSVDATKMMASRARQRVRGSAPIPDADLARQRQVVEAFLAASRAGDFDGLLAVLDPDVVLRRDRPGGVDLVTGAHNVASGAVAFARQLPDERFVVVNGAPGVMAVQQGGVLSVAVFTVVAGRIAEIDIYVDPERLRYLGL
jgi:RNA polymerase sigma-70 factor, ECF subfamily